MNSVLKAPRLRRRPAALVVAAALFLTSACGSDDSDSSASEGCEETFTIGVSHPVSEAQSVQALKRIMQEYSEERCVDLLLDSTTGNNLQSQRTTIESWLLQKVDAILLWPVDSSAFTNLQVQAREQGTKWLTYLVEMDGQDGTVGFNSEQAGEAIAENVSAWVAERYPEGGVEAAITTLSVLPALSPRWELPSTALGELGIPIVSEQDCADQTCGLEIASQALREHPDTRVFIGLNDDVALGIQKAVRNAGLDADDVYVSGYDGSPEGLASLRAGDGAFKVTMAIPIAELARSIIDNSIAAITGDGETSTETPSLLVTPEDTDTLDELIAALER